MKTRILIALLLTIAALLGILARSRVHVAKTTSGEPSVTSADAQLASDEELSAVPADQVAVSRKVDAVVARSAPVHANRSGSHGIEVFAPPVKTRHMRGIVTVLPYGYAVGGATVRAKHSSLGEPTNASTDRLGQYDVEVTTSNSMVLCSAPGCLEWTGSIEPGTTDVVLDIVLVPKPPKMEALVRLMDSNGRPFLATLDPADKKRFASLRPVFAGGNVARGSRASKLSVFATQAQAVDGEGAWFRATLQAGASGSCCLVLGDRVLDVAPFDAGTTDITLVATVDDLHGTEGSVRVVVVDKTSGRPFAGAQVRVMCDGALDKRGITGPDGLCVVEHILEGEARVSITSFDPQTLGETARETFVGNPQFGEARTVCFVHGGQQTDLGRMGIERTVTISGSVDLQPETAALPKVSLSIQSDDENGDDPLRVTWSERLGPVNKDGTFRFSGLRPGWYDVSIDPRYRDVVDLRIGSGEPMTVSVAVDARFGDADRVRLDLRAGRVVSRGSGPTTLDDF